MKSYDDDEISISESTNVIKLFNTKPLFPSRCLSIALREMEEAEAAKNKQLANRKKLFVVKSKNDER